MESVEFGMVADSLSGDGSTSGVAKNPRVLPFISSSFVDFKGLSSLEGAAVSAVFPMVVTTGVCL